MLLDNILSTLRTQIATIATETDSGESPAQTTFKAAGYSGDLEDGGQERVFDMVIVGGGDRNITGVPGRVDAFVRFQVRVRFVNEARSPAEAFQYYAADMRRLADMVPQIVMTTDYAVSGAGVGACTIDGEWSINQDADEPSVYTGIAPFIVEYHDVLVTA